VTAHKDRYETQAILSYYLIKSRAGARRREGEKKKNV
jgi:hypothetical protein